MQLLEVGANPAHQREFLQLPVRLYKHDACWIRPLDTDIADVFDPRKNQIFQNGVCIRWLLKTDSDETIGRVAAFVNRKTATVGNDQPTGGMGFFECIDDQSAAFRLFDACRDWLKQQGMEAMDGPINFGDRDRWWGLLVDGFDKEPSYGMPYTKPYYIPFFEQYGFRDYFQQHTFYMPIFESGVRSTVHPSVMERAMRILNNPDYEFRHIEKSNLEKYAEDFRVIYNAAWANNLNTGEMTPDRAQAIMKRMKPIIDEDLMWFGYHGPEKQPVAFFISLPELNQYFKHVNGKLNLLGKLKFLYHKLRRTNDQAFGVIFGVIPTFQGRGIESAIGIKFPQSTWHKKNFQYKHLELNWVGDFNPKMMRYTKIFLGATPLKRFITYRCLFDQTQEFKRHPLI